MSAREWSPGDVAVCKSHGLNVLAADLPGEWWHPGYGCPQHLRDVDIRRAVVIDPEDREQVERLAVAYATVESARSGDEYRAWDNRSIEARGRIVDSLTAALREFATPTPPKPPEPMGWLAAVIDDVGDKWVRDGMPRDRVQSGHWWNYTVAVEKNYDGVLRADWHAINVVRVLSEGVTP